MNTLTFKYTKANGTQSDRVLVIMVSPNTMYEGIDVSELSAEQQGEFIAVMNTVKDKYLKAIESIKSDFDLVHSYRRFDPTKMTNVVKEVL